MPAPCCAPATWHKCANSAVNQSGKEDGFSPNKQMKIHLSFIMEKAHPLDQFENSLKHVAEMAVPKRTILPATAKWMLKL